MYSAIEITKVKTQEATASICSFLNLVQQASQHSFIHPAAFSLSYLYQPFAVSFSDPASPTNILYFLNSCFFLKTVLSSKTGKENRNRNASISQHRLY